MNQKPKEKNKKPKELYGKLTEYEKDMAAAIIEDLGGAIPSKAKRKNPMNYRTKGVVNYPLYMFLHGDWNPHYSVNYSKASEDHALMQYLKEVLNDAQYSEVLFHKNMTPIEFYATKHQTWSKSDLKQIREPL